MPRSLDLIFSDLVPDRGGAPWPENPGYLVDAINVRFTPNGYRSQWIDQNATGSPAAVGATPIAAVGFGNITTPRHYAGTAAKIYESDDYGATWNDNAGAAYSASDWDFTIFGSRVIAVNANDNPQTKLLGDAVATNFADLAGTPPKAARVARIRDSLVLGELPATDTYGLRWSSIGDPQDFPTPGSATALARQAGSVSLGSEHGVITQLVGGEKFGFIFQERAITRMTYVGGDIQFSFDVYSRGIGTGFTHSAIRVGNVVYFLNATGVYSTDGYSVTPLSIGKVDDTIIFNLLSHPHGGTSLDKGVAYDYRTKCVCWPFSDATNNYLLCYDVVLQTFKTVKRVNAARDGTLYSVHNGASTQNSFVVPHYIDTSNHLRRFDYLTAVPTTLRTGFVELLPGQITDIYAIEILGAKFSPTPTVSVRSEFFGENIDLLATGYDLAQKAPLANQYKIRKSGRFHSFQYVDPAQAQAALVRGMRIYYDVKSGR